MSTLRRIGLLAAMPLAAVALGGAAANPTGTYHGVFDDAAELSATCPEMFTPEGWSGVWNLQLKDGVVGSPVMVQMNLKFEGRPHAVWRAAFETVDPDAGLVLEGVQDRGPMDQGYVSLGENGTFTYTRDLNIDLPTLVPPVYLVCEATYTGHLTN